jgi:hypothetical protein
MHSITAILPFLGFDLNSYLLGWQTIRRWNLTSRRYLPFALMASTFHQVKQPIMKGYFNLFMSLFEQHRKMKSFWALVLNLWWNLHVFLGFQWKILTNERCIHRHTLNLLFSKHDWQQIDVRYKASILGSCKCKPCRSSWVALWKFVKFIASFGNFCFFVECNLRRKQFDRISYSKLPNIRLEIPACSIIFIRDFQFYFFCWEENEKIECN